MLKWIDKIVWLLNLCVVCGLLGSYTASYVDPNVFVLPSLLGLAYPYLLIFNLLFFLYWIIRWKKKAWITAAILLLGYPTFTQYYGIATTSPASVPHDLSLLSYNIRYFDLYNWSGQQHTQQKLFDYLNQSDNDLLCLQEAFMPQASDKPKTVSRKLYNYPYRYIHQEMAIFSRIPFLHQGYLDLGAQTTGSCIYIDVLLKGDTVRIYSIHLESYKLGHKERQFVKDLPHNFKSEELTDGVKSITSRLTVANRYRARQARQIAAHIRQSPYPVILCGDFNDNPLSFTYHKLKENLQDCFIEKGRGLGNTYIGEFPSFRIDYILHTSELKAVYYKRENIHLSDHYPIIAKLKYQSGKRK